MRRIAVTLAVTFAVSIGGTAIGARAGTHARGPASAAPRTCGPCTYVVTPTSTGTQSLQYVVANAQPSDVIELADGIYHVGGLDVTQPGVTIRALNLPAAGAPPRVWLDGSVPYQFWSHPTAGIWSHPYNKDFCESNLRGQPCNTLSVSYHGDQLFEGNTPIPQTIHASDLLNPTYPVFYVSTTNNAVLTNFDPGTAAAMTDQETAIEFERSAVGASLQGIGIRRYAGNDHDSHSLAAQQDTAVFVNDASSVTFTNDWFSFNSVRGLKTQGDVPPAQTPVAGAGVVVSGCVFDHNGELALDSVDSDGINVAHSLFYRNNYENFQIEQGAAKFLSVHGAVIQYDQFTANNGIGLWFDRSAYMATIAHNSFTANQWHGIMFEISARATITGNVFDGNGHVGMLIYEASEISFSHNLLIGNLDGIKVQEGHRTRANFPSGQDADPDRVMPADITFDVSGIDIHSNGFYYYPAHSNGEVCDPNANAVPTASEPDPFDGCQYMIAGEDSYTGQEPSTLGIQAVHDNFHTRNWPSDPSSAAIPVYTALWKAPAASVGAQGCVAGDAGAIDYRWVGLSDFQCTGQESGGSSPY